MPRAEKPLTTPADAPLVDACRSFLAAAAELDQFGRTGLGDGTAITARYYAALNAVSGAVPRSPGAYSAQAIATHLRRAVPAHILRRAVRHEIATMVAGGAP